MKYAPKNILVPSVLLIFIGAMLRGYVLVLQYGNSIQDSDEAVVGLMAKHILNGVDFPLIWYGQQYMGTLHAYITAVFFFLFGISGTAFRLAHACISLGLIYLVYCLGKELFNRSIGIISALWIAVPPPFLSIFSLKQGTYTLTAVFGTWILLLSYRLCYVFSEDQKSRRTLALLGFIAGIGVWTHFQILPYLITAGMFLLMRGRKHMSFHSILLLLGCFLGGCSPLLLYNLISRGSSLHFLLNFARGTEESLPFYYAMVSRSYNFLTVSLPTLLGGAPMWSFFRIGATMQLPVHADELVFFIGITGIQFLLFGWLLYEARKQVYVPSSVTSSTRMLIRCTIVATMCVILTGLCFSSYLREYILLAHTNSFTWFPFAAGRIHLTKFLRAEFFSQGMLVYLLYLPAIISLLVQCKKSSVGEQATFLCVFVGIASSLYVLTPFGDFRSPRYIFPLYSVISIIFAFFIVEMKRYGRYIPLLGTILIVSLHFTSLVKIPPHIHFQPVHYVKLGYILPASNQPVIDFLRSQHINHVYTKYWLGFPLAFDSQEEIVISSGSPGRYPPYDTSVAQAERVAYLFHVNAVENAAFEGLLQSQQIPYEKARVSYYDIYYQVELGERLLSPLWSQILSYLQAT